MSAKPTSWGPVRSKRRRESFVGRAQQLAVFESNFGGDVPQFMVFSVTGEGGVGKSELLKQYATLAAQPAIKAEVILCDERQPSPVAAMGNERGVIGLQFHPEVTHTPQGKTILKNFLYEICGCSGTWTPGSFIAESIEKIREQTRG